MNTWLRAFLAAALAGALTLIYCRPAPVPPGPPDVPPAATWPNRLAVYVVMDWLARDAAAGRRPLAEVAALFRALGEWQPAVAPPSTIDAADPPVCIPADTEAERLCRQVALYAHAALWVEAPERAAEAVTRLEAEYFAAVEADGEFRLPEPPPVTAVEELLRQARAWIAEQERRTSPAR
jgi:hypothetical protein